MDREILQCMEEAGYSADDLGELPEGDIPADSLWADPEVIAAEARCLVETGHGEVFGDDPEEVIAKNEQAITMTTCLRDRGWEVDDPERHPVGGYLLPPTPTMPQNPDLASALNDDMQECAEEAGIEIAGQP